MKKCIELKGFPLVFIDCDEKLYDLRNKDNCPSYNNLMKKEKKELCELNIKAVTKQLDCLTNNSNPYIPNFSHIEKSLNEELTMLSKEILKM